MNLEMNITDSFSSQIGNVKSGFNICNWDVKEYKEVLVKN